MKKKRRRKTVSHGKGSGNGVLRKMASGNYRFDYRDENGQRRRVVLSSDRTVAEQMQREILRERDLKKAGLIMDQGMEQTVGELVEPYLKDVAVRGPDGNKEYVKGRGYLLKPILKEMGHLRLLELRPMVVRTYMQNRVTAGRSPVTVNQEVKALRAMINYHIEMDQVAYNPIAKVKLLPTKDPKTRKRLRRSLTIEEGVKLYQVARDHDTACMNVRKPFRHTRNRKGIRIPQAPLFLAFLKTGNRVSALVSTVWGDYDDQGATLTMRGEIQKNHRQKECPIPDDLAKELRHLRSVQALMYGRALKKSDPIFLSPSGRPLKDRKENIRRYLYTLLKLAGIDRIDESGRRIDVHALRVTFNTWLAREHVDLEVRQRLMGHSDPRITTIYTDDGLLDKRGAVDSLPLLDGPASEGNDKAEEGKDAGEDDEAGVAG